MKIINGIIVSTKMEKTSVVEVTTRRPHPLYRKLVKISKKFSVDNGEFQPTVGQHVKITEIIPMSKNKHFRILEIIDLQNNSKKKPKKTISKIKKGAK